MQPQPVTTGSAAGNLPFSPAIIASDFVFTSGQVGRHPETGEVAAGLEAQTVQTMENLKSVLQAAGTSFDRVVKVNVYLKDIDDFDSMNQVYRRYFPENPPARTTIGNIALANQKCLIEIEMVALKGGKGAS